MISYFLPVLFCFMHLAPAMQSLNTVATNPVQIVQIYLCQFSPVCSFHWSCVCIWISFCICICICNTCQAGPKQCGKQQIQCSAQKLPGQITQSLWSAQAMQASHTSQKSGNIIWFNKRWNICCNMLLKSTIILGNMHTTLASPSITHFVKRSTMIYLAILYTWFNKSWTICCTCS